jgi:NodT family efflux transporter outer membrane factor (OMF) lipoprotein
MRAGSSITIIVLTVLFAAGCSVHKRRVPDVSLDVPGSFTGTEGLSAETLGKWWERFGDERLNALMEEAFRQNLDLARAYERLMQARAAARITGSSRGLSLDVEGSAGRARQAGPLGAVTEDGFSLSAAARYEVDLWRKLASRTAAARFDAHAAREDVKALYISLSAQFADLYYLAVEQRAQLELAEQTIAAFEDTLKRVESRYREGLVSALDVYQSRQNLASARAQRPEFEANLAVALNALSVLLGRFPQKDITGNSAELPEAPEFPAGIPSELLNRRPDVTAALLRLEAGDRRVAAAVADRFPSFNLVGGYGGASKELNGILDSPNIFWNLLLQVAQPLLDGGRRKAEAGRTEAAYREGLALYRQAVLGAFRDVEDALARGRTTAERIAMLEERTSASEGALRLSLDRYLQGLSDYLPVLTAQQSFYDARNALLAARRRLVSDRIQLARALGGDWAEPMVRERMAAVDERKAEGR